MSRPDRNSVPKVDQSRAIGKRPKAARATERDRNARKRAEREPKADKYADRPKGAERELEASLASLLDMFGPEVRR